jgi:hypothetical protein
MFAMAAIAFNVFPPVHLAIDIVSAPFPPAWGAVVRSFPRPQQTIRLDDHPWPFRRQKQQKTAAKQDYLVRYAYNGSRTRGQYTNPSINYQSW